MNVLAKTLVLICFTLCISACATGPSANAPLNQSLTWSKRRREAMCVNHWQLKGVTAIRTPKDNFSASLHWIQNGQDKYNILLFGPLGTGNLSLTRQGHETRLETSDGHNESAENAEALMMKKLKWSLPVSNLYYWVRGIPAPGTPANMSFDQYHHVTSLEQQGWKIDYLRYTGIQGMDLPSKIFMDHTKLHVRLVVSSWEIEKNCVS